MIYAVKSYYIPFVVVTHTFDIFISFYITTNNDFMCIGN